MLGGASVVILGARGGSNGQSRRPKGPTAEVEFLGRGSWPLLTSCEGCKLPNGVRGRALAVKWFSCILEAPHGLFWNLLEPSSGGGMTPLPPPYIRLCLYGLCRRDVDLNNTLLTLVPYISGKQNYKYTVMSLTIKATSSRVTLIYLLNKACSHDI